MSVHPIQTSQACNKLKRGRLPYQWDLNIYRGCTHGCKYCYAQYSHQYLDENNDFFSDIYVKENIVENLERQLAHPKWKKDIINLGGVCDSYQPLEVQYQLMPEILRVLIKHRQPCLISSKSVLILRDIDLFAELAEYTYVNVAQTITCLDENIRSQIEPGGAPSLARFEVLKEFSKTKAFTGVHLMPIIPYLTDDFDNVNGIYQMASEIGVDYLLPGTLYLRGKTRGYFQNFFRQNYPDLYEKFWQIYTNPEVKKSYKRRLYQMIEEIKKVHGVSHDYGRLIREKLKKDENKQLKLFQSLIVQMN